MSSTCNCETKDKRITVREEILKLTKKRGCDKSICPSEVARAIFPGSCWRKHMQFVRSVGFELAAENTIEICQKGVTLLNPSEESIKGPLRFRCPRE